MLLIFSKAARYTSHFFVHGFECEEGFCTASDVYSYRSFWLPHHFSFSSLGKSLITPPPPTKRRKVLRLPTQPRSGEADSPSSRTELAVGLTLAARRIR